MSCKVRTINKFYSMLAVSSGGILSFSAFCAYRGDETFYSKLLMPFVNKFINPEFSHQTAILLTRHKLINCNYNNNNNNAKQQKVLKTRVFDLNFDNVIGIAAGFDKNSDALAGLANYGVGFAEIGTVTPKPQAGNDKPRVFRITQDQALINRCGFNNKGIEYVRDNMLKLGSMKPMLVGLNLGKNKDTSDMFSDYLIGLSEAKKFDEMFDYIVINISSPNTPNLRVTQQKKNLQTLIEKVLNEMYDLSINKPLLIKIAPDVSNQEISDISSVILESGSKNGGKKVDGLILTNTTVTRPQPVSGAETHTETYQQAGGLSGKPLCDMSTKTISEFYKKTKGKVPIIGVGGVFSGQDAFDKIKAGASLVQLYTGITFKGPPIVNKIKVELADLLEQNNYKSIDEAVGADHK